MFLNLYFFSFFAFFRFYISVLFCTFVLFVLLYFITWLDSPYMNFHTVLLYFYILFCTFCTFVFWTIHMNFHAKSGVCSSKNDWVIALGTKEDTYVLVCLQVIIQSKPHFFIVQSLDNNCKIRVRSVQIGQFLSLQK